MSDLTEAGFEARVLLQDTVEPSRYTSTELTAYGRDAIETFFRIRPDLRVGVTWVRGDVTVPDALMPFWSLLVEYIVAKAELREDQFSEDSRVVALFQKVRSGMMSTGI